MHTFTTDKITFNYNSDFSGDVVITNHESDNLNEGVVSVPAEDLLVFIVEAFIRPKMIETIEQTPPRDLLLNQLNLEDE